MNFDFPWRRPPFPHQIEMAEWHYSHACSMDLSEVGTGKTMPMIMALEAHRDWYGQPILIVAPNSILDNWKNEIESWSNLHCAVLRGSRLERQGWLETTQDIFIINYEGVRVIFPELLAKGFHIIILDEAHHIKNPKAKQTKCILQLGKQAVVRKIMTGTLLTNDLQDVWSIAQFVSPKIFNQNFWGFRQTYLEDKNAGKSWAKWPDWQPKPGAVEEVRKKIEPYAIRFEKRKVLKWLPPVLFERRSVDMSPEQRRVYNELKREFIADLDSGEVVLAPQILTRILKMIEVTSGFVYKTDDNTQQKPTYRFKQNAKLKVLEEMLEEIGNHRVVIWATFREDVAMINAAIQHAIPITGDTPADNRQEILDSFNQGAISYLICNPSCAGEGLTILAPYAIYYSRGWKLGERLQSLGRHDRPGAEQFGSITVIDLVCEQTIDAEILAALERKEDLLNSINPRRARAMI